MDQPCPWESQAFLQTEPWNQQSAFEEVVEWTSSGDASASCWQRDLASSSSSSSPSDASTEKYPCKCNKTFNYFHRQHKQNALEQCTNNIYMWAVCFWWACWSKVGSKLNLYNKEMIDHGKEIRKSGNYKVITKRVACLGRREMSNNGTNERVIRPQVVGFQRLVSQRMERNSREKRIFTIIPKKWAKHDCEVEFGFGFLESASTVRTLGNRQQRLMDFHSILLLSCAVASKKTSSPNIQIDNLYSQVTTRLGHFHIKSIERLHFSVLTIFGF